MAAVLRTGVFSWGRRHRTNLSTVVRWYSVQSDTNDRSSTLKIGASKVKLSYGDLAEFTSGSSVSQIGNTSVLATVVVNEPAYGQNAPASGLPLTVDYCQKSSAVGRIPTNFLRRDIGRSRTEILTSRIIDRSIRPMFHEGYSSEVQVTCELLAADGENQPDVAAINAASTALAVSDVPCHNLVGAVRVGLLGGKTVLNPTVAQLRESPLDMVITGNAKGEVVMVEAVADNVTQPEFRKALRVGVRNATNVCQSILRLQRQSGKYAGEGQTQPPAWPDLTPKDEVARLALEEAATAPLRGVLTDSTLHKASRASALENVKKSVLDVISNDHPGTNSAYLMHSFHRLSRRILRDLVLDEGKRCDGRGLTDLRHITCQTDLYEPLHGSALFKRGQTQVMCTVTFDSMESAAKADTITEAITGIKGRHFMLDYEFPGYATNDIKQSTGGINRRELGHGNLAERGLQSVVPLDFPFAIRLTSTVLASNGSSSMASVCGGSLALMDAGVPLTSPAAGVAVGLVTRADPLTGEILDYKLLTDIQGMEDYAGDMDFKMAGTKTGITALQMDIKLGGVPLYIAQEAVQKASDGKHEILKIMNDCISKPREIPKSNMPVIEKLSVPPEKRMMLVGPGGTRIKKLEATTGVKLTQVDVTTFEMFAANQTALDEAKAEIETYLNDQREPTLEFGCVYKAVITEIRDNGVRVRFHQAMQPVLLPNSQLASQKVNHPSVLGLVLGQEIDVKYFGRDPVDGTMRVSRKAVFSTGGEARKLYKNPQDISGS